MTQQHPHPHTHNETLESNHTHNMIRSESIENFILKLCLIYEDLVISVDKDNINKFLNLLKLDLSHEEIYLVLNDIRIITIQDKLQNILSSYEFEAEVDYVNKLLKDNKNLENILVDY